MNTENNQAQIIENANDAKTKTTPVNAKSATTNSKKTQQAKESGEVRHLPAVQKKL